MSTPDPSPLDRLLTLGEAPARATGWPDYLALGIEAAHAPELIRIVAGAAAERSDSEGPEVWAPIHAWRALGQLRATSAVEPLAEALSALVDWDWAMGELPTVFGMIGGAAVPALARVLSDSSQALWTRAAAVDGLQEIATSHPDDRPAAVAALLRQMEKWYRTDETLNGFVIASLLDLQVREAAPLMEQAYAEDRVDWEICGDWEEVQVELGLLPERQTPRPSLLPPLPLLPPPRAEHPAGSRRRGRTEKKAKRKMARQSRKKNRRRR